MTEGESKRERDRGGGERQRKEEKVWMDARRQVWAWAVGFIIVARHPFEGWDQKQQPLSTVPNLYLHTTSGDWKRSVCVREREVVCVWGHNESETKSKRQEASSTAVSREPLFSFFPLFPLSLPCITSLFATFLTNHLPSCLLVSARFPSIKSRRKEKTNHTLSTLKIVCFYQRWSMLLQRL